MALKGKTVLSFPFKSLNDGSSNFWTASGSGVNEYYYNQTDMTIKPFFVDENGALMTEGTMGSLTAGQWAFGDNDTIGNNTVYVRLTDNVDPDTKTADYIKTTAPVTIFQAPASPTETISIGILICNNEDTGNDAKMLLYITDGSDVTKYVELFDADVADGPIAESTKIVLEPQYKLKAMTDRELVSVIVSENEG